MRDKPPNLTRFPSETLKNFAAECLQSMKLEKEDAIVIADSLIQADLWGHPSHGIMRLFWYGARIASGATQISKEPEWELDAGGLAVLNGQDGIGQSVAKKAMHSAIDRAKQHGISAVCVRNSGHFGTAMYYTKMAADAGCIGFISSNASPSMAPWGGVDKLVGNNPWSWSAPAGSFPCFMLDIANSAVARGKLYHAQATDKPIPEGWALDKDGYGTTNSADGIAGQILPMAGHKGYAISMAMDVLSGILSASQFGSSITGPYQKEGRSGAGHLVIVIDIAKCRPIDEFNADMESLIKSIKSSKTAPTQSEIFYPGELEARNHERISHSGIELSEDVRAQLQIGAEQLGIKTPFN